MKTYLFQLNHPAHYHLFKNIIAKLRDKGNSVVITNRNKDVLEDLLSNEKHINISVHYEKTIYGKIKNLIDRERKLDLIIKKIEPDLLLGTSPEIAHLGKINKIPSLFFGEDDVNLSSIMYLGALSCYPFFSNIVSPATCNNVFWNRKTIKYFGYHELAYLHPNNFAPESEMINRCISSDRPYFLIRFARLEAYHDKGNKGINSEIAKKIIKILQPHGNIYITSERELETEFEAYRIRINPSNIHHALYFADMYIGDSQTMAAEAGVLGTPFIRYNDFVGKIGYLNELENKYKLGFGYNTNQTDKMLNKVQELLNMVDIKEEFQKRRQKMLSEKIDVAAFMTWFIENYPDSVKIMKENPDYQLRFK